MDLAEQADFGDKPSFPSGDDLSEALAWQAERFPDVALSQRTSFSRFENADQAWDPEGAFVEVLMGYQTQFAAGMDDRVRGAHLMAFYSHHLSIAVGALFLKTGRVIDLDPSTLAVRFEPLGEKTLQNRPADARRLHFCFSDFASGSDPLAAFHDGFVAGLRPVVNTIASRSGLSPTALWRLAADGLTGAFLDVGIALCDEKRAMGLARSLVRKSGSPLSFDVHFEYVETNIEGILSGRFFRLRSGCCLFYRTKDGRFCDVCVLLDERTRKDRLRAHLEGAGGR
ncbi:(2Fe-2S)-binding protein [Pararhizobium gei]|uniref:(2Fe-2S)-binding protein n=1 Tax=Pararhizobium gei TaxID=1395951 RepID=UPI0023DBF7CD|nr:(2Fe-2S)-binding protein [Rhizobium gei]